MTDLHKDLTGADLHEPKGIESASAGQVYQADGANSGNWTTLSIPTGTFYVTTAEFSSSGTWTKPSNLFAIRVVCIGGGGGGFFGSGASQHIGTAGTTTFGSYFGANGGANGATNGSSAPVAGAGATASTSGNLNYGGTNGYTGIGDTTSQLYIPGGYPGIQIAGYGRGGGVKTDGSTTSFVATGGAGGAAIRWFRDTEVTTTVAITIGAAGSGSGTGAESGGSGYVVIEQYISVT